MKKGLTKEEKKRLAIKLRQAGSLPNKVAKKLAAKLKEYKKKSI